MLFRTDRNNNPTAFSVDLAAQAKLVLGVDYTIGDKFPYPSTLLTAKLLRDPVATTIKLIHAVGFTTQKNTPRWSHTVMPSFVWDSLSFDLKKRTIESMYHYEGGTELQHLFN